MNKGLWCGRLSVVTFIMLTLVVLASLALAYPSFGAEISITSPRTGAIVSGTVAVNVTLGSRVWWDELKIDGSTAQTGTITSFA
jgi:hypothetical protein